MTAAAVEMSVDKRRNNGPEDSYSPFYEVDEKWLEEQKKKRSSKGKARDDGRQVDELRPICERPRNASDLEWY